MLPHEEQQEFERTIEFIGVYRTSVGVSCKQSRVGDEWGESAQGEGARGGIWLYDIGRGSPKQDLFLRFSDLSQIKGKTEFLIPPKLPIDT